MGPGKNILIKRACSEQQKETLISTADPQLKTSNGEQNPRRKLGGPPFQPLWSFIWPPEKEACSDVGKLWLWKYLNSHWAQVCPLISVVDPPLLSTVMQNEFIVFSTESFSVALSRSYVLFLLHQPCLNCEGHPPVTCFLNLKSHWALSSEHALCQNSFFKSIAPNSVKLAGTPNCHDGPLLLTFL